MSVSTALCRSDQSPCDQSPGDQHDSVINHLVINRPVIKAPRTTISMRAHFGQKLWTNWSL